MKKTGESIKGRAVRCLAALLAVVLSLSFVPIVGAGSYAWATDPNIPITLTLNASKAVKTEGMQFGFEFTPAAPDASVAGAFDVPRYDSNNDGVINDSDDFVAPAAKVLTAAAMTSDIQTISDTIDLPDPNLYGHAGIYAYTVQESQASVPYGWTYSSTVYRVSFQIKNENGSLAYDSPAVVIENIMSPDSSQAKSSSLAFTNQSYENSDLTVVNTTAGDYANMSHAFPFSMTVTLPSWADDSVFDITTTGSDVAGDLDTTQTKVQTSSKTATITFKLANGQDLTVEGLPVGTVYSVTQTDAGEGLNVYTPTATFTFSGLADASAGYTTKVNNVTGTGGTPPLIVSVNGTNPNESTMVGSGSGNAVNVTNTLSGQPSMTGVLTTTLPYILLLALAVLCVSAVLTRRSKRRYYDED